MKWRIFVGLLMLIFGLSPTSAGSSQAQQPTTVNISPSTQTVNAGQVFTVSVYIAPDEPIAGAQFDLSFDASLLQANSVTEGNLFDQDCNGQFDIYGGIDNNAGTITSVASYIIGECSISNPGFLANISFTAQGISGTSLISMSNVEVVNPEGNPLSLTLTNGEVTVIAPGITITPTPISTARATPSPIYTPISTATTTTAPAYTPISTATATPTPAYTPISTVTATPTPALTAIPDSASELIFRIGLENGITDGSGVLLQDIDILSYDGETAARIASGTQITNPSGQPVSEITMEETAAIPPMPEGYFLIAAFEFGPDGTTFSSALQITLKYDIGQVPAGQQPVIAFYDEATGQWNFLIGTVDTYTGTFTFSIAHFTTYALMGHSATPVVHEGIALWVWIVIGIVVVLSLIVIIGLVLQRHNATSDTSQCNNQP